MIGCLRSTIPTNSQHICLTISSLIQFLENFVLLELSCFERWWHSAYVFPVSVSDLDDKEFCFQFKDVVNLKGIS